MTTIPPVEVQELIDTAVQRAVLRYVGPAAPGVCSVYAYVGAHVLTEITEHNFAHVAGEFTLGTKDDGVGVGFKADRHTSGGAGYHAIAGCFEDEEDPVLVDFAARRYPEYAAEQGLPWPAERRRNFEWFRFSERPPWWVMGFEPSKELTRRAFAQLIGDPRVEGLIRDAVLEVKEELRKRAL